MSAGSGMNLGQKAGASLERPRSLRDKIKPRGVFHIEHFDKDGNLKGKYKVPNGITNEGLNHILDTEFVAGTQVATWYIGLIDLTGFSALAAADTMSSHAGWAEFTAYSEGTRGTWGAGAAASQQVTNATAVDFTISGSGTVKGVFITSDNVKSGTTGVLWATALFASDIAVAASDLLKVTYTVNAS